MKLTNELGREVVRKRENCAYAGIRDLWFVRPIKRHLARNVTNQGLDSHLVDGVGAFPGRRLKMGAELVQCLSTMK